MHVLDLITIAQMFIYGAFFVRERKTFIVHCTSAKRTELCLSADKNMRSRTNYCSVCQQLKQETEGEEQGEDKEQDRAEKQRGKQKAVIVSCEKQQYYT